MNFRVSAKDLTLFIIFCIFLLYLSAVAVLNVTSLLNDGDFAGLLPFAAFRSPFLGATIAVFLAVLTAIFLSVSSYIFDKEKGWGMHLNISDKEEKGYNRWAKDKEMKMSKDVAKVTIASDTAEAAGVSLINNGIDMYVDNGENHTMVIGATGSGKTTAVVDPLVQSLAKKGESIIITDPKGELYRNHSGMLKSKGYNIIVLNFRNPTKGNAWNPLTLPYQLYKGENTDKATELLDDVALNILYDPNNKAEPFWEKSAADYFSGLTLGLFEDAKESQIHLNTISYMSTVGEEKFATSDYIKEYFLLKGESSSAYIFAANTVNAPTETKGGILSVFRQKIRLFASREQLSEMLSYSDFDMRDIGRKKTAVFMIIHDEKTTYHALATIFIKQCYETLIDVAQENGGKLPFRTNFILDEFANMPPLKDVTTMVTAARSRCIRFTFIIQNFAQLNDVYGKEDAETIRSNCGNLIYLITTELAALEEISKLCGEVKSKEKDKTASTPLVTVSDLQKMKMNEVIILRTRERPFKTKLTPSYEIDWGHSFAKGELKERDKHNIELFDIKDYVKTKKRNKLFEALDNADKKPGPPPLPELPPIPGLDDIKFPKEPKQEKPPEAPSMPPEMFNSFNPLNPLTEAQGEINYKSPTALDDASSFNFLNEPIRPKKAAGLEVFDQEKPKEPIISNNEYPKFDVDDLVKRIDAKIAELEKQEAAERAKMNSPESMLNPMIPETSDSSSKLFNPLIEDIKQEPIEKLENTVYERFDDFYNQSDQKPKQEPVIIAPTEAKVINEEDITDDQFYDDFYDDE